MSTQTTGVTQFSIRLQGVPNPLVFGNGSTPATVQVRFPGNATTWRQVKPGTYVEFSLGSNRWRSIKVEAVTVDGEAIVTSVDEHERRAARAE